MVNAMTQLLYPHEKEPYLLDGMLGGPQGWFGWVQKVLPPPGFDPWTIR
jgi:hypothetical protein